MANLVYRNLSSGQFTSVESQKMGDILVAGGYVPATDEEMTAWQATLPAAQPAIEPVPGTTATGQAATTPAPAEKQPLNKKE